MMMNTFILAVGAVYFLSEARARTLRAVVRHDVLLAGTELLGDLLPLAQLLSHGHLALHIALSCY